MVFMGWGERWSDARRTVIRFIIRGSEGRLICDVARAAALSLVKLALVRVDDTVGDDAGS